MAHGSNSNSKWKNIGGENSMKTKRKITILVSIFAMMAILSSSAFAATLNYPRSGQIAKGSGGSMWNAWDDKEDAIPYFMNLANNYGGSYESIGKSSGNNDWDIILFKFGNPNGEAVMVDSYLHGNEFYGYQVLKSVITWLVTSNDAEAQRILQNNYVLVVPVVNYRWGRTNYDSPSWMTANDPGNDGGDCGVNLNRNFGPGWSSSLSRSNSDNYSGTSTDSEPETQALITAWNRYHPRIYWNLHQGASPSTWCTASSSQAQTDANKVRSLLSSIQNSVGVSRGWSFSVSTRASGYYSKDGAASRGIAGFMTEVMSGWDASSSKKTDLERGNTFKQVKAMFIAMCRAVESSSTSNYSNTSSQSTTRSTTTTSSSSSSSTSSYSGSTSSSGTSSSSTDSSSSYSRYSSYV